MYCPDTLERLNSKEVEKYLAAFQEPVGAKDRLEEIEDRLAEIEEELECGSSLRELQEEKDILETERDEIQESLKELLVCDYCDKPATQAIPVYNPADGVRGVEGAYSITNVCEDCYADGTHLADCFYCGDCGDLFVYNHSWDVLAVTDRETGEMYCQKCYAENHLEGVRLGDLLAELGEVSLGLRLVAQRWVRLNNVPGKELLVEVEFSEWEDFPGCTSLACVAEEVREAAEEAEIDLDVTAYPCMTHGYQFSVVLGIFIDLQEEVTS